MRNKDPNPFGRSGARRLAKGGTPRGVELKRGGGRRAQPGLRFEDCAGAVDVVAGLCGRLGL